MLKVLLVTLSLAACGGGGNDTLYCTTVFVNGTPGQVCTTKPPEVECSQKPEACR